MIELLEYKNYCISIDDFCDIYDSPQVCSVLYDDDDEKFEVWTTDDYCMKFTVEGIKLEAVW